MRRILAGSVSASGKDHENFGGDEFLRDNLRAVQEVLVVGDNERELSVAPFKWGGECRIEVHLNAIADDKGNVHVNGFTSFFEGTSEDTPDEVDREVLGFIVPRTKGGNIHPTVVGAHMQNDGDVADVVISLTNTIVEDE